MNAYKQPDVGKSRSIFTPGATTAGRCCCRCCFISEDSLPHPGLSLYLSLGPPSLEECALPVSDLASSYLSFLPSVPIFVVSFGPTFIARCGICDSSGTDCSSDVFVPDPTFVLSSLLPSSLLPLHSLFSFFLSPFPPTRPSLTLSSPSLSVHFLYWLSALASLTAHLATLHGARQFFFFVRPSTFVSSTFCTDCTEDESEDIFVPDVVSDRLAFLSNLTAPGQLEHSSSPVIVFASWTRHTFPPSSSSEISMEKLTPVSSPLRPRIKERLVVRNEDDVVRIVR